MRRRPVTMVLAGTAAVSCAAALAVTAASASETVVHAGTWRTLIELTGPWLLKAEDAYVNSVSCGSAGNCAAGGFYVDSSLHQQAFVASEVNGRWGKAIEVPGSGRLNRGGVANVMSVSCAPAGYCAATGSYSDAFYGGEDPSGTIQAFVVSEHNGRWGKAIEVPGSGALNKGGNGPDLSLPVSCPSAGNCTVAGDYDPGSGIGGVFVASEVNGLWAAARPVPGLEALSRGQGSGARTLSCGTAGNCVLGGAARGQAFAVSEQDGRWGTAIEVPGSGVLNKEGYAALSSLSCTPTEDCTGAGFYKIGPGHYEAFVVSDRNGVWSRAIELPGSQSPAPGAGVNSVSCASAGNCAAGGGYTERSGGQPAAVANEVHGAWTKLIEVSGLTTATESVVTSLSCPSAGNCAAGGWTYRPDNEQAFVLSEVNGRWGKAIEVVRALNTLREAYISSVSCGSTGNCAAVGDYNNRRGSHVFVVNQG